MRSRGGPSRTPVGALHAMAVSNRLKPPDQVVHERTVATELESQLAPLTDDPVGLRIQLELAERRAAYLVGIEEGGTLLLWAAQDGCLVRSEPERMLGDGTTGGQIAPARSLRAVEEWVVATAEDMSWIHPRFRWRIPVADP